MYVLNFSYTSLKRFIRYSSFTISSPRSIDKLCSMSTGFLSLSSHPAGSITSNSAFASSFHVHHRFLTISSKGSNCSGNIECACKSRQTGVFELLVLIIILYICFIYFLFCMYLLTPRLLSAAS